MIRTIIQVETFEIQHLEKNEKEWSAIKRNNFSIHFQRCY